jgi:hypothetical protein
MVEDTFDSFRQRAGLRKSETETSEVTDHVRLHRSDPDKPSDFRKNN